MKTGSDTQRFLRYQSVVNVLLTKNSFYRRDIYPALKKENRAFIGRVIAELVRDGYLVERGSKSKRVYSWAEKKKDLDAGRWID